MSEPIAVIQKSKRESIHIAKPTFQNKVRIDIRIYVDTGDATIPTQKGVSFPPELLPQIVTALQQLEAQARAEGLLP